VLDLVEAIGGKPVGEVLEGQFRTAGRRGAGRAAPLSPGICLPQSLRVSPTPSRLAAADGRRRAHPLSRLADVEVYDGKATIPREWGKRASRFSVTFGPGRRQFRRRGPPAIDEHVTLPAGYRLEWGGQFEYLQRAKTRSSLLVPVALALIFILLYFTTTASSTRFASHRRAAGMDRRRPGSVGAGHAAIDLGRRRLYRPRRRVGAQQHGPGDIHPAAPQARLGPAEASNRRP